MGRLEYCESAGRYVQVGDGIVTNSLQTQQGGHIVSNPFHVEEPLVQPKMFESDKHEIILQKPEQQTTSSQEEPLVQPVMKW